MKAVFIFITLFAFGLFVNVTSMTTDEDDMDEDEFNHGFSMADGIDEPDFGKLPLSDVDDDIVDDDQSRMADPLRVRIRIRRPYYTPAFLGLGGYAGLSGYAGLGGFGLASRFGLGFDDVEDDTVDSRDEERSSATDDEEPETPTLSDADIKQLADQIIRISIKTGRRSRYPYHPYGWKRPYGYGRPQYDHQDEDLPVESGRLNVRGKLMCRCPICGQLYECPGYAKHLQKLH